mmetsp:Transcript_58700/g.136538  ORF Transcript_58700/g.136538 Transcript_58700/m.136538 type:complete len:223 (+) Transcript_58700:67-735(+)|eukprot:CAMPEP_0171102324 /NCGR_PEP_ID=MMETSP0766_2-20121228/57478_1 /TAXON_ID=439317 /ORGANISM="Gambierdiscus australes, Strain CAWD 149" /LENGTH=222 /DNA_ID=CAMNT_0011562579 /DNA_START=60 /DNA_END=728 /DNA_ORIENTATION=-
MAFIKNMAEGVGLGGVMDKVTEGAKELAQGAMGKLFLPILDQNTTKTLEFLGPKSGEIAVEQMTKKYSVVEKMDTAKDTAIKAASDAVMSFKDTIMDFVQDAIDDPKDAFKKVGILLLRAGKDAADKAVKAIMSIIPGCFMICIKPCANLQKIIEETFEAIRAALKAFVNQQLDERRVPQPIKDKLKDVVGFDFSPDEDVGEPKRKRSAAAPEPETMGAAST